MRGRSWSAAWIQLSPAWLPQSRHLELLISTKQMPWKWATVISLRLLASCMVFRAKLSAFIGVDQPLIYLLALLAKMCAFGTSIAKMALKVKTCRTGIKTNWWRSCMLMTTGPSMTSSFLRLILSIWLLPVRTAFSSCGTCATRVSNPACSASHQPTT